MKIDKTRILEATMLVLVTFCCLGIAEIGLRYLIPKSERHYVLPPSYTQTHIPSERFVPGISGPSIYKTSSVGIRGNEFSAENNEYRILAIGGSTTQNTYLDQDETWTLMLSQLLKKTSDGRTVWTGDVGRSGHTARSHVLQLQYLIPELPKIETVLMLVGVNDMTVALRHGFDYEAPAALSDAKAHNDQKVGAFLRIPGRFHEQKTIYMASETSPVKRLAIYQLGSQAKAMLLGAFEKSSEDSSGEIYDTWRNYRRAAQDKLNRKPSLEEPLGVYRAYLESIASLSRSYDVRLILMTQPTLWRDDLDALEESATWLGGIGDFQSEPGHEYFSSAVLASVMADYNETLLDVCAAHKLDCIDLASQIPKSLDNFYDDVHFTERGSALVAEAIARHLLARPPF